MVREQVVVAVQNGKLVTYWKWRFPNGTPGNVAWRFRTRKECEKHYRGFDGEAALMEELEVKKRNVKTWHAWRYGDGVFISADDGGDHDATMYRATFERIFGGRLPDTGKPVEFRTERVLRKRGKFAKRPARKGKAK